MDIQETNQRRVELEQNDQNDDERRRLVGLSDATSNVRYAMVQQPDLNSKVYEIREITVARDLFTQSWKRFATATMAIDGVRYSARSGSHSNTENEHIDGNRWAERARAMFSSLDPTLEKSWFAHVEPQLMACYITDFLQKQGVKPTDIVNSEIASTTQQSHPKSVHILVTQDSCRSCKSLIQLVNRTARRFGFIFVAEDRSLGAGAAQVVAGLTSLFYINAPLETA